MLNWSKQFNICCFMDANGYNAPYARYEALLAAGVVHSLAPAAPGPGTTAFQRLQAFHAQHPDWLFGHLGYDLKNELFPLTSTHPDGIGFPDIYFFQPEVVILVQPGLVRIGGWHYSEADARRVYEACLRMPVTVSAVTPPRHAVQSPFPHADYLDTVKALQAHIHRGDCYEINFCRENFVPETELDPLALFTRLNALSPAPFAAFYKLQDQYCCCASPERFVQQSGRTVISQPIKGTIRRGQDAAEEARLKDLLRHSAKERAENIMVVDLVRNDLTPAAARGSVSVAELCGIYTFAQVHHMISTVQATLAPGMGFADVLRHAFPMGSMTGAPKLRVMQLIEQYERSKRGLFSGSIGYITPEGDMDFNVVIRSMLYNAAEQYLSFSTGSAITFRSAPQQEWEECLLKASAMKKVLEG
ncbi:aminodeoxychorismate synthase component I [Chitinophaga parva]|uniref:Aminodeoxychorismate synthase component I n=2 Tax=Chitinophaga parva TaxID=2169414 RepID=A0A2T7BNF9_9BACT|nr:aminodeoxychorismate synthase component I [Chitinophaga parva]